MPDMVSAKLPKPIKFTPLAVVETTLVGRPGDELTVPQWTYSGDATEITEGQAIPIDQLGTKEARRYTLFQIMAMEVLGGVLVFTATLRCRCQLQTRLTRPSKRFNARASNRKRQCPI